MDSDLTKRMEELGDIIYKKIYSDKILVEFIRQIKDDGLSLSIIIEASPNDAHGHDPEENEEMDEKELDITPYDRHFLKGLRIKFHDDTHQSDPQGD